MVIVTGSCSAKVAAAGESGGVCGPVLLFLPCCNSPEVLSFNKGKREVQLF